MAKYYLSLLWKEEVSINEPMERRLDGSDHLCWLRQLWTLV